MVSKKQSDLWNKGASKTRTPSTATRPTVTNPFVAKRSREDLEEEVRRRYGQTYERDADDGERDFLDRLSNLTANRRRNKQLRQNEQDSLFERNLYSMQRRSDLDQLAAAGRQRFANGAFDLTSMTGKSAEEQGVVGETRDDAFHQNAYDFMTPEQRGIYEAFIGLGDRKSAKRYLASIEEGLQQQAADKLLQTIQPGNIENAQDFADVTRLGVRSGIGRFETGVQQLVNPNAVSKNYTEMAFEEARKDMSGATGVVADLANTVGFMLLPAGGSMVLGLAGGAGLAGSAGVKALSASLFGAASGGSTYNDMLKENPGADKFDAKVYSVINGALEGSLQYLLGGIGKLGAGGLSKVTGKTISGAVAKKLSNVAKASANTPAVKGLIKALVGGGKWAAGASDEALEEWLQAVLDPVMRNYVLGENNEVKLFGEDQLYAAFLGALGATVMNAPNNVSSFANAEQILNETMAKQEAKAAARANKNQPANAEAQAIPEATKEQIEAHMDNPDVKDLVIQINRLEAGIATGKSRHNDSPTGRKAQLAKAKKDLATLIAKLEQQQAPEQAAPADIPEMPKAPVENEEAIETLMRELGNVQDTDEAQPSGEQQLGEQARERALQLQEELGLTEEAPVEDEALPAEDEALPVEDEELPDEELPDEELPAGEEEEYEGYTLEETVDRFRADIAEAKRNRKVMRGEGYDYNQYIKMLEINFRHDAAELGMSEAEIEAIINSEGSTTRTVNRKEKVAPNPTETASEAVTDEDIDELLNEEPAPVENPVESKQATDGIDNIRDIADAVANEEMDVNEGYDEIRDLLNQMDQEREAAGEAVGVATEPEVTVTEGRIEVRFPKWPGRKTTDELRKAGFKWDKEAGIWFGGENNTNRALVERLTGVKLTEDEFKPEVRRIPKEELDNGGRRNGLSDEVLGRQYENDDADTVGPVFGSYGQGRGVQKEGEGVSREERQNEAKFKRAEYVRKSNLPKTHISVVADKYYRNIDCDRTDFPEDFLDTVDPAAIEWQPLFNARNKLEQYKAKHRNRSNIKLRFYALSNINPIDPSEPYAYPSGTINKRTGEVWIEVGHATDEEIERSLDHEYFHDARGNNPGFMEYIQAKLWESGLLNGELFDVVTTIIDPMWDSEYTEPNQTIYDTYSAYVEEFLGELFAGRPDWGMRQGDMDAILPADKIKSLQNVVRNAVDEYFDIKTQGDINDIINLVQKAKDNGVYQYHTAKEQDIRTRNELRDVYNKVKTEIYSLQNVDDETLDALSEWALTIGTGRFMAGQDIDSKSNYIVFLAESLLDDIYYQGKSVDIASKVRLIADEVKALADWCDKNGNIAYDIIERFSDTALNSTTREDNLKKQVPENQKAFEPLKNHEYKPESMDETTAKAWEWVEKHGGTNDDITEPYTTLMNKKGEWKPTEMEAALVMFGSLAQNGDENSASALAAKIIGQAPDFGRVINYFKILQRYMPNAVSAISRSIADQIDVELTDEEKANIDLCDRIAKQGFISDSVKTAATPEFREWLEEASEYVDRGQLDATTAAYAAAMSLVTAKQPSTARQKFRALQRISLLSNPKTHFRNILGNVAEQAGSIMSRPGADLTDRFISRFTNQRTFGSGGAEAFAKAVTDSVEKAVMDHALGINTVGNKFDEDTINRSGLQQLARQNAFDEKTHKALRNGISRVANNIDHLIGLGLSIGDAPFLIGTYEAALAQIMNANNATEATEEMMDTAWDVAFRRTFRDNNAVTKALTGIRNSLPFIGETIAPYVQTPVNVVLTAIQYSPIGVGEAFFKAFVDLGGSTSLRTQLKNNESTMKTQRQIAELVGRGALGTAAMLVGALLASAGRITGDDDDIDSQKEKNWNTATGRKGSSIKIGDTYIDPSSLQSLSTPIMAGAAAYEGKEEGDGIDWAGILGAAVKASMKMGNTMLEMPVLQGVADLFSGNYDNGELLAGALSLAGNAATQVVPFGSLLKQAGKAVDPYSRVQSEINAGPGERVLKSTVNNLKTMTPWSRKTLSQRYDVLGNPIKNDASDNAAERLYNSFINPFNTSKENTNEVTDEIDRLYAALQDTDVLPSAAGNSISYGGEKYKFTSAEKQEYQRVEGESNAEILSSLVNSEAYDQLTDEEKAKVLSSIYDYSSNKAKADYLKKQGVEYESDAKWMDSIDSIVETGVDIGSAMVYRYELNQIDGADEQAKYIMSLPISADQKKAFDTQFVDKFGFHPITDDRDYTSEDTLALSMTSDSGRGKYDRVFSGDWTAPSGNSYRSLSGVEFGELYDACYFKSSPTKAESIESIRNMLMEKWGLDDYSATTLATDFRAVMGSKKY